MAGFNIEVSRKHLSSNLEAVPTCGGEGMLWGHRIMPQTASSKLLGGL